MEDAKLALQLEADDEGRRQAVELGEAFPAAEELRLPTNLSTLLTDDGALCLKEWEESDDDMTPPPA